MHAPMNEVCASLLNDIFESTYCAEISNANIRAEVWVYKSKSSQEERKLEGGSTQARLETPAPSKRHPQEMTICKRWLTHHLPFSHRGGHRGR